MIIKKFYEYNIELPYIEIDGIDFEKVKNDNSILLSKAMELLNTKFILYPLLDQKEFIRLQVSTDLTHKKGIMMIFSLKSYDDYIYIKISAVGFPLILYKCDQFSGFKSFLKKNSDKINNIIKESSKRSFNRVEKGSSLVSEPKKKEFFDFLKRKNK
jgi:hypothetical protein